MKGAVVAVLTPVRYSLHPNTEAQVPASAYPVPAVKEEVLEPVSVFPITIELALGVKDETEGVVEPAAELPVDVSAPIVVAPLIS